MFDRVTLRVTDVERSERFYTTVLAPLGVAPVPIPGRGAQLGALTLLPYDMVHRPTRRLHVAFYAPTTELVDEFWRAGIDAGYRDDGAPGPRPHYRPDYYGAFLIDPDGNSAEAVHHSSVRASGAIDHLWLRVADIQVTRSFYAALAPHADLELIDASPEQVRMARADGSFTLLAGDAETENARIGLTSTDATDGAAGGGPWRDPDGNIIELARAP